MQSHENGFFDPNDYTTADDYVAYMKECEAYLENNADYSICNDCGGTGISAVMCCCGRDCGFFGMPIDFKLKCPKCGLTDIRLK